MRRALVAALALAAPGLGGTWLAVAHPCPVDMPWLAAQSHAGHDAQSSHGHGDAGHGSSSACSCVSACQNASAALNQSPVPAAGTVATPGWDVFPSASNHETPALRIAHRLPPATAPPLS